MPYSLKHIPEWNALEIKTNGKNSPKSYAEYMNFMDQITKKVQPDDYTYLIPESYLGPFLSKFGYVTTMTQTVGSILGNEKIVTPEITYRSKHTDKMKMKPYPFQQVGIDYLVSVKGGILGDEMGLGDYTIAVS